MKLALKKGAQSVSVYVFIQDSSKTTGEGLTGLAYNTTGLKCYYVRPKASAAQLSLKTQTVTGAHDAGGFKEVDATNMPGIYRLDLHNNILADGVDSALVMLHGADDMAPCPLEIQLTDFDLNSNAVVTNVATLEGRLTATRAGYLDKLNVTGTLANTNNASSFMANVAALALEATAQSIKAKTDNLPASPAAVGSLMGLADGAITAAKIASNAITDAKIATDAIAGAKIKADAVTKIQNGLATPTNITKVTGAELASTQGAITWGQQKILADVHYEGALHIVNENEDGFGQYNEGGGIGQVNMGEYAGQGNVSEGETGYGQLNVSEGETGSGQLNSGGRHGQYNVSQGIDGSGQVNIGNKSVDGYDPALALEATLSAIKGATWTNETLEAIMEAIDAIDPGGGGLSKADVRDAVGLASANLDTQLTNIKTDTGNVSTRLTATRAGYLDKLNVTGTLANTDNASTFKADTTGLALEATLTAIKGAGWSTQTLEAIADAIDQIDTGLDAAEIRTALGLATANLDTQLGDIQSDLNNPSQYKADISGLATSSALSTVSGKVDAVKAQTDKLPNSPAPANEYDARLLAIQSDLDNPSQYKADVSGLAKTTDLSGLAEKTDIPSDYAKASALTTVDGKADAIKAKTDNLPASPAATGDKMTLEDDAITEDTLMASAILAIQNGLATSSDLSSLGDIVDNIDEILDKIEGEYDIADLMRLMGAVLFGTMTRTANPDGTLTLSFKDIDTGALSRVTATIDASNNRASVVLNP